MLYILNKTEDNLNEAYLVCDDKGNKKYLTYYELSRLHDVCDFYESKLGLVKNGKVVRQSYTIIGKFIKGRNKEIFYLVSDTLGNMKPFSRAKLLGSKGLFTNAIVSDKIVKFKSGSIPSLISKRNVITNKINDSTVIKISRLHANSVGSLGANPKFIGRRLKDNKMGVVKFPLSGGSYDCINEVVCYELGKLFGFDVAEASIEKYKGQDCIISCYMYDDIGKTNAIQSLKSAIDVDNFHNIFNDNWIKYNYSKSALIKFIQMLMFDYLTRQQDRHISNIAFYNKDLYSLYDNGRC